MDIGIIAAMPQELGSFLSNVGEPEGTDIIPGYEIKKYRINDNMIYITGSGAGEIAAAATAQMFISVYHVDMMLNFGVVGGLTPDMSLSRAVVIDHIVHYDYDASPFYKDLVPGQYPGYELYLQTDRKLLEKALSAACELVPVTCASADKFIDSPETKRYLHEKYNADICEMESAGVYLTCSRCGIPSLFIKAVSDSAQGGAEQFEEMIEYAAKVCVKIVMDIINNM
ncbi:MAG: 5'-methylthioadenosine/S-adenosylhomocysteine nucleosidase [Oscillospiraceae bacterium]|nr:5'-methylthioadenosine/S-adenosylhomocysteine nucleosidase [Oscillospiraceae bacterium]